MIKNLKIKISSFRTEFEQARLFTKDLQIISAKKESN